MQEKSIKAACNMAAFQFVKKVVDIVLRTGST